MTGTTPMSFAASCCSWIPAELEDPADPDEFRDHQLIGLTVLTVSGEHVGTVADVLHYGQDLLVVAGTGKRAGAEIMVPFVSAMVPEVDLAAGAAAHRSAGWPA